MNTARVHGQWLYACGHEAYQCRCPHHVSEKPHFLQDLCADCREQIIQPPTPTGAGAASAEPFPKATD